MQAGRPVLESSRATWPSLAPPAAGHAIATGTGRPTDTALESKALAIAGRLGIAGDDRGIGAVHEIHLAWVGQECSRSGLPMPARAAMPAAWTRLVAPSFRRTRETCTLAVFGLMNSVAP